MSETLNMSKEDFQQELNQMLLGEIIRLKMQLAVLRGDSVDEMADMVVKFMQKFVEIFPEESQARLQQLMGEALGNAREQDGGN